MKDLYRRLWDYMKTQFAPSPPTPEPTSPIPHSLDDTLVVGDRHSWMAYWSGRIIPFEDMTPDLLGAHRTVVLAPLHVKYLESCQQILDWKRSGFLPRTRLLLGTYKGRHLWSPENDALVERWVVHARSEREILDSDRLTFMPLCVIPPRATLTPGDDGTLFLGGRKWRDLDIAVTAMSRSGYPGRVISDLAPEGKYPNVEIRRERIPKDDYIDMMEKARLVLVPLKGTPFSHGHVDVVTAILLGKPVLVTAGASCDDYVEHGVNGLLVPENTVEAWTAAILEAWEKADAFSAAARERAGRYTAERYAQYVRDLVEVPDARLIGPEFARPKAAPDRSELERVRKAKEDHDLKLAHYAAMREANGLLKERRYEETLAAVGPCLDGPLRASALRLRMKALLKTDLAGSEDAVRSVLEEVSDDAASRSHLASVLIARGRDEDALAEARIAVEREPAQAAFRGQLIGILVRLDRVDEACAVLESGLLQEPDSAVLARARKLIASRSALAMGVAG